MACAPTKSQAPPSSVERELKLAPGPFAALRGTALGDAMPFDNDIYNTTCYPLMAATGWSETAAGRRPNGPLLLWVNRAHVTAGRVFIRPCEVGVPIEMSATRISGYINKDWFEATLVDDASAARVQLSRLIMPKWNEFGNPSFCGSHIAYWSQEAGRAPTGGEMTVHVVSLFTPAREASASFGVVPINPSDMGMGVPEAAWTPDCTAATFTRAAGETRTVGIPAR